jgi:hypothetical protein
MDEIITRVKRVMFKEEIVEYCGDVEMQEISLRERCADVCQRICMIQKHFYWTKFDEGTYWFEDDWSEQYTPKHPLFVEVEYDALRILEEVKPEDGIDVSEIKTFLHWRRRMEESIALHNEYHDLWWKIRIARWSWLCRARYDMGMSMEEAEQQLPCQMREWKDKMQVMLEKIKGNPYINPKYGQDIMNNIY